MQTLRLTTELITNGTTALFWPELDKQRQITYKNIATLMQTTRVGSQFCNRHILSQYFYLMHNLYAV